MPKKLDGAKMSPADVAAAFESLSPGAKKFLEPEKKTVLPPERKKKSQKRTMGKKYDPTNVHFRKMEAELEKENY
jgi:hypothetical protein